MPIPTEGLRRFGLPRYVLFADQLDSPVTSDWAVNALANASADTVNSALVVRRFDDTVEEGVSVVVYVPIGVRQVTLTFMARAQTAPGSPVTVRPVLYTRMISANAAVTAWSSAVLLTPLTVPANAFFQRASQTILLSTLGLTMDTFAQLELTRRGTDASDTLVGDWDLLSWTVEFT